MCKWSIALAAIQIAALSPHAIAATVTFSLELAVSGASDDLGVFTLRARSSTGDNSGICGYLVELGGEVLNVDHSSLRSYSVNNNTGQEGPVGFTAIRSADITASNHGQNVLVAAGHDLFEGPSMIVYGLGQTAGNLASQGFTAVRASEGDPWAANIVLATGTFRLGSGFGFVTDSNYAGAYVFQETGSTELLSANVVYRSSGPSLDPDCPEPTAMALCGLAITGFEALRRRRAPQLGRKCRRASVHGRRECGSLCPR